MSVAQALSPAADFAQLPVSAEPQSGTTYRAETQIRQAPVEYETEPEADDDGATWLRDDSGALVLAEWTFGGRLIPVRAVIVDYAAELAARTWELAEHGTATCDVIEMKPHGYQYGAPPRECSGLAERSMLGGWVCAHHFDALSRPIAGR